MFARGLAYACIACKTSAVYGMRNFQFRPCGCRKSSARGLGAVRIGPTRPRLRSFDGSRMRSRDSCIVRCALTGVLLVLASACAHERALVQSVSNQARQDAALGDTFKPNSPAEYPDLTPGAVSRRFLEYLALLGSVSDLSPADASRGLGFPLKRTVSGGYAFRIVLPASGWSYGVDLLKSDRPKRTALSLDFANDRRGGDAAAVCEVGLNDALAELKKAGFAGGPEYGEIGQLENYSLSRGKVYVVIREWAMPAPREGAAAKACLESISVHSAD